MPQGASLLFHGRKGKTRSLMCSMRWGGVRASVPTQGHLSCREPPSSRPGLPEDVVPGEGGSLGSARRPTTRDSKPIADPFPHPGPIGPPLPDSPAHPALLSQQVLSPCHLQRGVLQHPHSGLLWTLFKEAPQCSLEQGTHVLLFPAARRPWPLAQAPPRAHSVTFT